MNNVYALVTYLMVLIVIGGIVLEKIYDIFEKRRFQKYYELVKEDSGFWQMKLEQSGMTIGQYIFDHIMDELEAKELIENERRANELKEQTKRDFDEMIKNCKEIDEGLDRLDNELEKLKKPTKEEKISDVFADLDDDMLPF